MIKVPLNRLSFLCNVVAMFILNVFQMGAYHTLDLGLNRKFTLRKALWDSVALERVEMACDPAANADVAAVVMQEGLAHVCLITPSMTLVRSKIDITIPRKRKGFVQQHEKVNFLSVQKCIFFNDLFIFILIVTNY